MRIRNREKERTPEALQIRRINYANRNPEEIEKVKLSRKEYGSRPRVKILLDIAEKKRSTDPEIRSARASYWLFKKYGITLEQKRAIFDEQKGLCAICDSLMLWGQNAHSGGPCLDHNHITGKVRGLLYQADNLIIRHENSKRLRAAADYLDKWNNRP